MKPTKTLVIFILAVAAPAFGEQRIIDLSHAYDEDTIYWPTDTRGFEVTELAYGKTDGGWFYSSYSFCTAEHGGTHLDAPIHFSEDGLTTDHIPLDQLVGAGIVIDVTRQASANANYLLSRADVAAHEAAHGRIERGAIVLLRTGWSARWPNTLAYLGDDTPGDATRLSFPSYGADAARLLIDERGAAVLGIDTASIDAGRSKDFAVHQVVAARQVPGLENLTNLDLLPASGFTVVALPMKIGGGSGAPVRVIALLED